MELLQLVIIFHDNISLIAENVSHKLTLYSYYFIVLSQFSLILKVLKDTVMSVVMQSKIIKL